MIIDGITARLISMISYDKGLPIEECMLIVKCFKIIMFYGHGHPIFVCERFWVDDPLKTVQVQGRQIADGIVSVLHEARNETTFNAYSFNN